MVTDDVVIMDIADQALDIFLHCPESAHKNGIVKTFTHMPFLTTSTITHPPMHTPKKQRAKPSTHQTAFSLQLVVLFLSIVLVGNIQEAWQMSLNADSW